MKIRWIQITKEEIETRQINEGSDSGISFFSISLDRRAIRPLTLFIYTTTSGFSVCAKSRAACYPVRLRVADRRVAASSMARRE